MDEDTKTLIEWYEDLKAYVYQEIEGITITGLVILGVASVLTGVYLNKKEQADTEATNKAKIEKEINSEDNIITWNNIANTDVLKIKTLDGKEDIIFVNYERIVIKEGYTIYNVTDILKEFPSFQVNSDKNKVLTNSFTIEEQLGDLTSYLTVNNYIQNSYTEEELENFRTEIKAAELNNKKQDKPKGMCKSNSNYK